MRTYGPGVDIHPDGQRFVVAPPLAADWDPRRRSRDGVLPAFLTNLNLSLGLSLVSLRVEGMTAYVKIYS